MGEITNWLKKEETQEDMILSCLLFFTLLLINGLIWGLVQSVNKPTKGWLDTIGLIIVIFIFLPLIILIIYWEIQLTKRNLVKRWIDQIKETEKKDKIFRKANNAFRKKLVKAYNINKDIFGEKVKLNEVELVLFNSRSEFSYYGQRNFLRNKGLEIYNNLDLVGRTSRNSWLERVLAKKRFTIIMLSPSAFDEDSNFDKKFAFHVLVHEVCHTFIRSSPKIIDFLYNKKDGTESEEYLCYYIADQKKYFKKEYLKGKKIYQELKNLKVV